MDRSTARFLDQALEQGADPTTVLRNPSRVAKKMGVKLSSTAQRRIKRLGAGVRKMDAADREALNFFNRVVVDGRYLNEFATSPAAVAGRLNIKLSAAAQRRLRDYRLADVVGVRTPGTIMSPAAVAVVVAAIIVLWSNDPRKVIVDRSGHVKL